MHTWAQTRGLRAAIAWRIRACEPGALVVYNFCLHTLWCPSTHEHNIRLLRTIVSDSSLTLITSMSRYFVKYSLLAFPIASSGLGVWQIKRLEWKKNLIADLERQTQSEPVDLLRIDSLKDLDHLEYRRVKVKGTYDPNFAHQLFLKPRSLIVNEEAILRGRTAHQSNIGVNVITSFSVDGTDLRILVNRGWLASRGERDNVQNSAHLGLGSSNDPPIEIHGILRKSDTRPRYGAKNDESQNVWQFRDIDAMAKVLKTAPIYIELDQDKSRREGPYGGQTSLSVRNEHLNYAITWFSLSVLSYVMWYSKYGKRKLFTRPR